MKYINHGVQQEVVEEVLICILFILNEAKGVEMSLALRKDIKTDVILLSSFLNMNNISFYI